MAITAATTTADFSGFLTPAESAPIFDAAARQSVFQSLFRRVPLGISGQKIPIVTSKPTANWTSEGGKKHSTNMGMDLLTMTPEKLTAIAVMSAEVVRADPGSYATNLRSHLAEAFAVAFDLAVGYNLGGDGTGTGPFEQNLASATKTVELGSTPTANGGIHGDFVAGLKLLVEGGSKLTGFALDDTVEPLVLGAVDGNGRPLYVDLPYDATSDAIARPGRLLNRASFMGEGVANGTTKGFGLNATKGAWGAVGGISYRVSTEATVTINGALASLWENNLVAVLAEAEYGFVFDNVDANVVKFVDAVA